VPTPELRLFCITAGVAVTIDWLYQLSFFAAIMCECGMQAEVTSNSLDTDKTETTLVESGNGHIKVSVRRYFHALILAKKLI
jgi:hypothetical protein